MTISASVGRNAVNRPVDVKLVQERLTKHAGWLDSKPPGVTGVLDPQTTTAIVEFQRNAAVLLSQDGQVSPGGFTIKQLMRDKHPRPEHRIFSLACFSHSSLELTVAEFADAAKTIGCEGATVNAIAIVEGTKWDANGGPGILFERHKFSKHSKHAYDRTHPDISNLHPGGYGLTRMQYSRLRRAGVLDAKAALMSASWGKFQILGENFEQAGFKTVEAFVNSMMKSEQEHLKAFGNFAKGNRHLKQSLIDRNWEAIAKAYNGPDFAKNNYDIKLRTAYDGLVLGSNTNKQATK